MTPNSLRKHSKRYKPMKEQATRYPWQQWMHALNTQDVDTELKAYAAAQGDEL